MLELVVILKAVIEVALLALLGQGLLYLLAGKRREQNLFYQILKTVASPALRLGQLVTPRQFPPAWVAGVTVSILLAVWVTATYYKVCLTLNTC